MAVVIDGTTGISTPAEAVAGNLSYTGTLTSGTGVVNIGFGQVYKDASGNVGIGTSSPSRKLEVSDAGDGQIRITGTAAANGGHMLVYSDNGSIASFGMNGSTGGRYAGTGANVAVLGTLSNNAFAFGTNNTERARIDSNGRIQVNGTTVVDVARISVSFNSADSTGIGLIATNASGGTLMKYQNSGGTTVGQITTNASTTSYVTTSDYRLKEDIAPMTGALAAVTALKPVTYKWKSTGEATQGFIAHELQAVVPECVVGEKDAVDADGNPQYQGIDTSFLVATLAAAIQELKAVVDGQAVLIAAQATRITALEGAAA